MASQPQHPHSEDETMKDASPPPQEKVSRGFTAVNQSYLTPPNDIHHSFSSEEASEQSTAGRPWDNKLPPLQERSPPVSPEARVLPSINSLASGPASQSTDPPLYPDERSYISTFQAPLFTHESHDSRSTASPPPVPHPTVTRPLVSTSKECLFPQRLGVTTPQDALTYYRTLMTEFRDYQSHYLPDPRHLAKTVEAELDATSKGQLAKISSRAPRVTKARAAPTQSPKAKVTATMTASASLPKATPQRRRTPKLRALSDPSDSTTQSTNKHTRAAPSKKVENDNVHWSALPDYAPPTSSLDALDKKLDARWAHNSLDLSNDPDRMHLHPQELQIAQRLRLECAAYLSNKRKIFAARLQSLKESKNFTKTAAQAACSIDVNKASQLWVAFDNVGWFKESWFQQWL